MQGRPWAKAARPTAQDLKKIRGLEIDRTVKYYNNSLKYKHYLQNSLHPKSCSQAIELLSNDGSSVGSIAISKPSCLEALNTFIVGF